MKKFFSAILIAACCYGSAGGGDSAAESIGSIYGVVTIKSSAEPMRATGVELYRSGSLLLKTVTYDDGHYEFSELSPGEYRLRVEAEGYADVEYDVTVEAGRTARADMQLEEIDTGLTVRTLEITDVSGNSVKVSGTATRPYNSSRVVSEGGFVYATHSNPRNGGTKATAEVTYSSSVFSFTTTLTPLAKGTYYVQAYAKNDLGTAYGEVRSFEISGAPSVTTLVATNVSANTATLNAKIEYKGDPAYTERGFVYSNSFQNPTIEDPDDATTRRVVSGISTEFGANISGLTAETTYHVRAYVTNSNGTVYGASVSFKPTSVVDYIVLTSDGIMVQKNDISSGADWNTAKSLCESSTVGGKSGWRLPSDGELTSLYNQRNTIGGFSNTSSGSIYWSGTKSYNNNYYYYRNFYSGSTDHAIYTNTYRVRCVRTLP
jgi:hypothetical protein